MRKASIAAIFGLAIIGMLFVAAPASAQVNGLPQVAVCGNTIATGANCIKPNADGSINVSGGGGGAGDASAANQELQIAQEELIAEGVGAPDDTVCATSTGDCTLIALHKKLNTLIDALNALVAGEVPAGDEEIGKTTPTITNLVRGTITSAMTGTTSTSLLSAPGASVFNYITNFTCSNMDADTDTVIALQDGNGGTTFYSAPAARLGGGFSISFPVPLKQPTAATALYVVNETSGATTKCSASGFTR